jgi:hypothetical protein
MHAGTRWLEPRSNALRSLARLTLPSTRTGGSQIFNIDGANLATGGVEDDGGDGKLYVDDLYAT